MAEIAIPLTQFQHAPTMKIVRAKYSVTVQLPSAAVGHTRSNPAEVGGSEISPRFRIGKASELPVDTKITAISSEPAFEPLGDPTLG